MSAKAKLTVRLPAENLEFVKRFAREHGMTVTEVLDRYLTRLREASEEKRVHPEVERISGLVPVEVDARAAYAEHIAEKHR